MAWWLPLIAAGVNELEASRQRQKEIQDAGDDTVNRIRSAYASSLGGEPYSGMASNLSVGLSRARRDYEPANNAVGLALQALGRESSQPSITGQPMGFGDVMGKAQVDPWDLDPWGDAGY